MSITSCNEHLSESLLQLDETLLNKFNNRGEGFNQIITCEVHCKLESNKLKPSIYVINYRTKI